MKIWNREVFGNVNQTGEILQKKIQELDARDDEDNLDESGREERRILLVEQSQNFFKQEAIMRKKACTKWLKQGDLNTKFFHSFVKWRRMRNEINKVEVNDQWCDDKEKVKAKVREFFKAIFDGMSEPQVRLDNVRFNSISDEDNALLVRVVFDEEVKDAVWRCDSLKSPGLDGFNFSFIKFCWECLKDDFVLAVKDLLVNGKWPRGSNASFICLIPKTNNLQQLRDFRPISLVGCVYKIILKILSIRVKKVINKVIDARKYVFLKEWGLWMVF